MIELALQLARKSTTPDFKMGCVVTNRRGHLISTGVNSMTKTHPTQAKYAAKLGDPDKIFLHAEIHALVRCKGEAHTLYVARVKKNGSIGLARPCPICYHACKVAGVKKIVYTDEVGVTEEFVI